MGNLEKEAIKKVIEKAYIQGIHGNQDEETVKSGFHRDFAMLVMQDDALEKVMVDEWLARVEVMKAENPDLGGRNAIHFRIGRCCRICSRRETRSVQRELAFLYGLHVAV
jgi:hypothetical protein